MTKWQPARLKQSLILGSSKEKGARAFNLLGWAIVIGFSAFLILESAGVTAVTKRT